MDLYAENILDHYRHPRNKIPLLLGEGARRAGEGVVEHQEANLSCGDSLTIQLRIENGTITAVGWQGTGCAISQAAMSMLSEELTGMSVEKASVLGPDNILKLLGVPVGPRRMKCAMLGLEALKHALRKRRGKEMRESD